MIVQTCSTCYSENYGSAAGIRCHTCHASLADTPSRPPDHGPLKSCLTCTYWYWPIDSIDAGYCSHDALKTTLVGDVCNNWHPPFHVEDRCEVI